MKKKEKMKIQGTGMKHKTSKGNSEFMIVQSSPEQMEAILLHGFKIKKCDWKCHYCGEKLIADDIGGIMPDMGGKPILLCKSVLCTVEYYDENLVDYEGRKEREEK